MERRASFERVARALGGKLIGHDPLEGGISADVERLDISLPSGESRAVVYRSHRANEWKHTESKIAVKEHALLTVLAGHDMAVASPLLLIEDEHALVTAWVEGSTVVELDDRPSALDQMAEFLVELHRFDLDAVRSVPLPDLENPATALPQYLPALPIAADLDRALEMGGVAGPTNEPVLIHGDYWPGNVLWHDGRLAAVIDWEDACIGDPLADLASARAELVGEYDERAMRRFSDAYLSVVDLDTSALPLWDCYVSATALASMHEWGLEAADEAHRRAVTTDFFERAAAEVLNSGP